MAKRDNYDIWNSIADITGKSLSRALLIAHQKMYMDTQKETLKNELITILEQYIDNRINFQITNNVAPEIKEIDTMLKNLGK